MPWFMHREREKTPVNWKTNLLALWISQFLSLCAFSFCIPFLPLYLKESGIVPVEKIPDWSGVFLATASFSMMIMSPIWGSLGDKYGRKMMLVRANLGGAFVLYLMGTVANIESLIVLRILQGAFTGTTPAAQTLVATNTPDRNQGFAMGLLMAAVNAGTLAGNTLGGLCAKYYGAAASFKAAGIMLVLSTVLVVAAVGENFTRPEPPQALTKSARYRRRRESITNFAQGLPLFIAIGVIAFIQTFDSPYLSLYIDDLYRNSITAELLATISDAEITSEVYGLAGRVNGVACAMAIAGSIGVGVVLDRKIPLAIWPLTAALAGVGALWSGLTPSLFGLTVGRAIFLFFVSGLASALVVVLGRMTPSSRRGAAMGWSVTIRSVGWGLAPLVGAYSAKAFGFGGAFVILAAACVAFAFGCIYIVRRYQNAFNPMEEDPPSIESVGANNISAPGGQGRMG